MSHPSAYDIAPLDTLTAYERATITTLDDFLSRDRPTAMLPLHLGHDRRSFVARRDSEMVAEISYSPLRFIPHRDPGTGRETVLSAAQIQFPRGPAPVASLWEMLFEAVFGEVFDLGISWCGVYLPPGYRLPAALLRQLAFEPVGMCDDIAFIHGNAGFREPCQLWARRSAAARGFRRPALYPQLASTTFLRTADASTAPEPNERYWNDVDTYSGFSGYPWLPNFIRTVADQPQSVLSIPCATGDIFRLWPTSDVGPSEGVGVDILEEHLRFARHRMADARLDQLNGVALRQVLHATKGYDNALGFLRQLGLLAGRPFSDEEAHEYTLQLLALVDQLTGAGAVTDWFAISKAVGRLLRMSPSAGVYLDGVSDTASFDDALYVAHILGDSGIAELRRSLDPVETHDEWNQPHAWGSVNFVRGDATSIDLGRRFDLVVSWEAYLMFVGEGLEREFTDTLERHLAPGGTIVASGIRRSRGTWGHDLLAASSRLQERGFSVALTGVHAQPALHAESLFPQWFPTLVARMGA